MTPACASWMPIFFTGQLKTIDVRRDQIHQQQRPDEVAAGQDERNLPAEEMQSQDKPLPEVMRLRRVKPFIHLGQRADEHQDDGERQQGDGQLERRENRDDFFNEHRGIWPIG